MRESIVAVVSFVLVSTALSGCGFEDEGVVDLEAGQCSTQPGTITVVPTDKTSTYRLEALCEEKILLAGICTEQFQNIPWSTLWVQGVCFSDDNRSVVAVSLPQGGVIESDKEVMFQLFPYASDPEAAFEQGYTLESGNSLVLVLSEAKIVRIRTPHRRSSQ